MMMDYGLCPTECHSLEHEDGFKYSFVKLLRRAREGQIRDFMLYAIKERGVDQEDADVMLSRGVQPVISGGRQSNALVVHPVLIIIRDKLASPQSHPSVVLESWVDKTVPRKRLFKRSRNADNNDDRSLLDTYASDLKDANKKIATLNSDNKALKLQLQKLEERHARRRGNRRRQADSP